MPQNFDDIDRAPIAIAGHELEQKIRIGSIAPYISSVIHDSRSNMWHLWCHLGQGQGGQKAMMTVYDQLKGLRSLETSVLGPFEEYDYRAHRVESGVRLRSVSMTAPATLIAEKALAVDIINISAFNVIEMHIGDARSYQGHNGSLFTLVFRDTDTIRQRYHSLYRHLHARTPWAYFEQWMPQMWQWMRAQGQIEPLTSVGSYSGWSVSLREADLLNFIRRELSAKRFHFPPRPVKIVPILTPEGLVVNPASPTTDEPIFTPRRFTVPYGYERAA